MKDFLEKLSQYEIMNNFLAGASFWVLIEMYTKWNIVYDDVIVQGVLYYVSGLIIGRIGSLFIEPFLKSLKIPFFINHKATDSKKNEKFLTFVSYTDYIEAEKIDEKIEILNNKNNVYRSITAVCFCFIITKLYEMKVHNIIVQNGLLDNMEIFVFVVLMLIFALSYRKQTKYVVNRVRKALDKQKLDNC